MLDGSAAEGSVLAAATKAAVMQPLLPAAHHARGLALEARGDHAESAAVGARGPGFRSPGGNIMLL